MYTQIRQTKHSSVYVKLTSSSTHLSRLVDVLELTLATVVKNKQLCGQAQTDAGGLKGGGNWEDDD